MLPQKTGTFFCGHTFFYYFCYVERLVRHTARLVAQHNCVIVPGLGAFLAHSVPASYCIESAIFMPPHRALGFNPQVTVDDALLVSEYIYAENLNYDEACRLLHDDVAALRNSLSANGTVHFGELGTLSMNLTGKITFGQSPNGIDDPYSFGLEPLAIQQVKEIEKKEIVIKRSTFNRAIAMAAAVILMFFFVSPLGDSAYGPSATAGFSAKSSNSYAQKRAAEPEMPQAAVPAETQCEIAPVADTVTQNIITVAEEPAQPAVAGTQESAPAVQQSAEKRFSIIVASTPNEEKARLAIEELTAKVQASYTVVEGSGRHRIAHSTYSSSKEAASALTQVKETFPDAWVLTH